MHRIDKISSLKTASRQRLNDVKLDQKLNAIKGIREDVSAFARNLFAQPALALAA